ncbi:MAG: flagellar basal body-associated FliL family protein [Alphaproteobacteria bacterium]|nr:flagellar basal body-associated FliL family protein [Alphaproteobacteria bacterium]
MKYALILLVAIALLGAGGAAGFFAFQKQAVASLGPENAKALAEKMARDKAAVIAGEEAKKLEFVELDSIILPIIDSNGVSQVVTLIVSLEVGDKENVEYVKKLTPRLKDAFIQDMYGVLNRKASMDGGVVKVDELKKRLNRVSTKILGENKINSVLLQVVNQRPI